MEFSYGRGLKGETPVPLGPFSEGKKNLRGDDMNKYDTSPVANIYYLHDV